MTRFHLCPPPLFSTFIVLDAYEVACTVMFSLNHHPLFPLFVSLELVQLTPIILYSIFNSQNLNSSISKSFILFKGFAFFFQQDRNRKEEQNVQGERRGRIEGKDRKGHCFNWRKRGIIYGSSQRPFFSWNLGATLL